MTKFLVSAKDVPEAKRALAANADIVELTDEAGTPDLVREIATMAAGKARVCVDIGDAAAGEPILHAVEDSLAAGADYLRVGVSSGLEWEANIRAVARVADEGRLIAVLHEGSTQALDLLPFLAECRFLGAVLNLAGNGNGRLLQRQPLKYLVDFIDRAKALSLQAGLAGALEPPDVPRLLPLKPDFLCFHSPTTGQADESNAAAILQQIRKLIPSEDHFSNEVGPDIRRKLLHASGMDKIFVRDFVLPVEIGAYSSERGRPQKVRFDVTAETERITDDPRHMHHVVSYDTIMDGIRSIVARGHITLVETLAEDIARQILADPRVGRVTVKVEKLEIAPARVGVEIVRTRGS